MKHKKYLTDKNRLDLGLAYHTSLKVVTTTGGEQAWHTLYCSLTVASNLCALEVSADVLPVVNRALDALMAGSDGWQISDDAGKLALYKAVCWHDQQLLQCTVDQYTTALERTLASVS